MAQLPKGDLVKGHDKPIHGSCAIYFPGGMGKYTSPMDPMGYRLWKHRHSSTLTMSWLPEPLHGKHPELPSRRWRGGREKLSRREFEVLWIAVKSLVVCRGLYYPVIFRDILGHIWIHLLVVSKCFFCFCPNPWGNDPVWLILFFKWVETDD